jgi:quercetin dioxygenase-like cupin family protein
MYRFLWISLLTTVLILCVGFSADDQYLAPKSVHPGKYVAPQKPIYRIQELKAKHAGHADWRQTIIDDDLLHAEYISAAPGNGLSKRFHPDNRAWWVVMEGEIQFEIEGQETFVARRGSIVQVPKQTMFALKTIGDKPSLRYEVNVAKSETLYPKGESPAKIPGFDFTVIRLARQPAPYGNGNVAHVTFDELARNPTYTRGLYLKNVINDDRASSGFIYGYEKNLPPLAKGDRGHYHTSGAESWIILAGQIKYTIEGQEPFIAEVGDVVYVPPFTYHSPRFYGDAPACRLSMNGYVGIAHLWDVPKD